MLQLGDELAWVPDYMKVRYQHWVEGLNGDWLFSRQRFFGVPIPLWYPVSPDGSIDYDNPIIPTEESLPVDPSSAAPPGYAEDNRGQPGGFISDPDVMDTWATSSLTPQIAAHWEDDPDLFDRVFPMDLRPQGPEIIRTWLFATMLRSHLEHDGPPWERTSINGWILDPDRKKMSKSKDNVVTPLPLIEEHGAEAIRYWACKGRPGADTAVDFGVMKIGRRLAIKVLNASRFVLNFGGSDQTDEITEPLDRAMLAALQATVEQATAAFEAFDYARALEVAERSFWQWTDDYLELVKTRAYGDDASSRSAHAALRLALSTYLRLLAPTLPFATEEVWSWWRDGSVHRTSWPQAEEFDGLAGDAAVLEATAQVLSAVRGAKSNAKVSMRTEVELVTVTGSEELFGLLREGENDLLAASRAALIEYVPGEFEVDAKLAD